MADYIFLKKNGKGADIKVSRQDFAKNPNAYRDYTVRMVDKDGSNWDVPFNHINDAVKDGAHVFNMRDNTPQQKTMTPAPQPKSAVAQQAVNFTQKPAQPYQPTWQEQAGMSMAVDQAASMGGSDVQPMVKPGLDTNMLNQNNALANRAMATNLESNQDNLYLDELEKKANELQKQGQAEVEKQQEGKGFLGNAFDAITGARTGTSQYQSNLQANEKMRQGTAIQKNVDDARKAIKDAEISQKGSWYQKLGRGLANGFDVRNFDLGLTDLQNALTLRSALNNPNDVNNAVLDSEALKNKIIKENEDKISDWIKAGETTTIMVPFMVQIASSPFSGLGTAASKWAMSKVGQEIAGSLGKRAALLALKGTTRFLGDAVEGAGTSAFFNTAGITADAMRRQRGNAVGQYGSDGYFHYNEMKDGEDSYAKAFAKAFGASAIEYQSELVGEYFSPLLKGIGKVAGKGLQKAGVLGIKEGFDTTGKKFTNIMLNFGGKNVSLDKTIGMITALSNKQYLKAFNDFTKATRWNGVIGEYAEEVVGNIENAALIGDMNWGTGKNGVFNPEQNWETFLSVAVGGGFLGALGGVSYIGSRIAVNRGLKKSDEMGTALFGADAWRSIKDGFETADNPARFLASISQNLDEPSKRAIQNYAAYSMAKKGELVANMKQRMEEPQPTNVRITPYKGRFVVQSIDPNGNIIESKDYDSEEDANIYKERVATYIDNARKVQAYNDFILRDDTEKLFEQLGIDNDTYALLQKIAYKDPLKRTDAEQELFDKFINDTENITYPTNEVHEEHEAQKGADLAEETSENIVEGAKPLNDREAAAKTRWNAVVQSQPDIDSLVGSLVNQGMTSNEIAQRLVDDYGGESEVVEAFCELCNAKANKDGYINRIGQLIQSKVENDIDEASFAGTVNGNEDKSNIYLLTNGTNTFALIGGDITVDSNNNISSNGIAIMLDGQGNRITRPDLTGFSLKGIVDKNQYKQSSLLELQQEATAAIQATETVVPEVQQPQATEQPQSEVPEQEPAQEQPQVQEEQPQESVATTENESPIPLGENGEMLYHKAPIEATINYLYDGALEDEEIRDFVQNNIDESTKGYDKITKKKPKIGTDKNAYLQAKQAWQQQVDEAKQKLDYWNSVNDYIQQQTHTTPEEIQKAQDELSGKTAQQEYANSKPDMSVTPVQFAGEFIRESKIQTQSFYNETGFGDAERKKFPKMIANDGKTIDSLAEELVSADDTYHNGSLYHGDTTEAKNAILEALQTASKKSELGKNTSDDFKEYERQREEAREAFYEENFNMSYSDYLAFEEQQMPNIWRKMSNFVAEEYDRIVNESYELRDEQNNVEQINNENNGNNTEGNRQLAGGSEVLPTEGSNQQGGTSTSTNPAAETTNGSEGSNQNEEVPGGAQGVNQSKIISEEDFDINSIDFENNYVVAHQTLSDNAESIINSGLRTAGGLMGTSTFVSREEIERLLKTMREGHGHRGSDSLVIMQFPKSWFNGRENVKLDDISTELSDRFGFDAFMTVPSDFISNIVEVKVEKAEEGTQGELKKNSVSDNTIDTDETVNNGKLNDTATQQNTVSDSKDTTKSPNLQENQQKTDKKSDEGQQNDETAAAIKKDIEDFIAKSTHDVQITNYDEKEFEAQISVDGKPSNIVITPPMEYGESMHAEYRPTEGGYQELGDLLDEYNEGLEPKEQGFAGEHLAATFPSVDAAINFEKWFNDKNNPKEKPWDKMDENEKMEYVFSQPLLTEEQIKNAQTNEVNKANALAYIKGQKSMVTRLSYYITYKNVKHSTGSSPANNEAGDTSQLDETNSGGSEGRRTEREHSGLRTQRVDSEGSGQTNPNQSGEQLLRSEDGKGRPADISGKEGDKQVPGDEQPMGRPDTGSDRSRGSGIDNGNGHNVSQQGGKGRSRKDTDTNRRGTDKANRDGATRNAQLNSKNIDSQLQSEIDEFKNLLAEYRRIKNKKNGNINSSIIPGVTINSEKIEAWGRLIYQGAKVGYLILRKGHTSLSEWSRIMKDMLTPAMYDIEVTDAEIDEFIKEMWHCNLPIGDEVHTISEWSRIIQKNKLKEAVRLTLEEKKKQQLDAESVEAKITDKNNIAETLPYLLPLQQDDVYRAEMQFFDESHNDYEHAYGKGYMFTNGTGTGKTYTGLGIAKRFIKQGKGRILILTPSSTKVKDWVLDAANLNIKAHNLEKWANAHKTTATTSKAEGVVVTTYANFRQNQALLEDEFDLVIYDESHRLLENKKGSETEGSKQHYMLTNKNEQWAFNRLQTVNQTYKEIQETRKLYDSEYDKEKEKFQDEADAKLNLPTLTEHISKHEGYPNLKAIKEKYDSLVNKYNNEVKPQLEKQAKESVKKTKVVFLSATPFNTKENLGYAEGYIFQYPQSEGRVGRRNQFYLTNFGAAYRWRNNRLESRTTNPEAVAAQEVAFSDYLQNQLGTMSGRVIDSEYDYSRDFPTVTFEKAGELNRAFEEIKKMEGVISRAFYNVMTNYQYTSVLFEAMKTSCILPRIKEHINAGRKVVLFHRRMESARPITPPFQEILNNARILLDEMSGSKEKNEAKAAIADYEQRFAHMLEWEKTLDLRVPRVQILEEFGDDSVLFFSGKETTKQKNAAVEDFNRDSSPKKIIVIQEASGKEGISLHDVTGENQRVLISLAMPQSPITALQIEGRIYRIGNKSNAIFEYPLLGLDEELITWGQRFNAQVGTTENLALGSKARNLRESFARAVIEHSGDVPLDSQGTGGKEMDEAINQDQTDPFDKSILDFYGNARIRGKRDNREGKDYYPTPEPLGFMMVKWANLSEGESVLEPSAGHGAIARYVPLSNQLTSVEPSTALFGRLQVLAGGIGRKFENDIFENYNVINKHDVVLMNPPFGTAGRLAIDHVAKAFKHLSEGGRIVAIIPRGSADAKFDKWIQTEKSAALVGEIQLPNITFQNAGTQVACRVVIIDKISNEQMRNEALGNATQIELPNNYDRIEDFFEDLRGITMPARTIDQKTKNDRKIMSIIKELKDEYGDDYSVEFTPTGVLISGVGLDYLNLKGDMLKMHVAAQYARANKIIQGTPPRLTRLITTYETIKKMALKLADMSEEEMENYISQNVNDNTSDKSLSDQFVYEVKKNTRTGQDMYVVSKNKGVNLTDEEYNKARELAKNNGGYWSRFAGGFIFPSELAAKSFLNGGNTPLADNPQQDNRLAYSSSTNNVNNPRIIPEDVDKDVSLQIESEFDEVLDKITESFSESSKKMFYDMLDGDIEYFSYATPLQLEDEYQTINLDLYGRQEEGNNRNISQRYVQPLLVYPAETGNNILMQEGQNVSPGTDNKQSSTMVSTGVGENLQEVHDNTAGEGRTAQARQNRDINDNLSLLHQVRLEIEGFLEENSTHKLSSYQARLLAEKLAISREVAYRRTRQQRLADTLGIKAGRAAALDEVAEAFEKTNKDKEIAKLFEKILAVNKRLGTSIEILPYNRNGRAGEAGIRRNVYYFLDGLTQTFSNEINIPVVIAHELLHQGTLGAINLVMKGKAEGVLTKEQIDAVNTIIDIYNKAIRNKEAFAENPYGLQSPYEFAAQMVDPRQRRALSMSPLQRVMAAANELKAQGNNSLWERIKNALKTLFGLSDLKKMDNAINTLLDTFNETVHDISMNDVDQNGWGYFIGEQGASNMDKAEEATTRLDNLNVARLFENQGKDPKTIKWATGWERGADGKWRYEIPDITIKPDNKIDNKKAETRIIGRGFSQPIAKLSDIVESKELFYAYPQLKDIDITVTDFDGQTLASYNPIFKTITLPLLERVFENVYAPVKNWDEINEYIKNTQPFINSLTDEELDEAYEALGVFGPMADEELKNDKQWQKLKKESPKIAKFVEIKNSQPEKIGGEKIGVKVRDSQEARSWMSHEIQHAIQEIEGFASGGNLDSFEKDKEYSKLKEERLKIEQSKEYLDAKNEMDSTFDEIQKIRAMISEIKGKPGYSIFDENKEEKELEDKLEEAKEKYFKANDRLDKERKRTKVLKEQIDKKIANYAYDYYTRVSGEVESRNVQSRLNMTPEQRSRSLASETEDVAREDQIFIYDNFGKNEMRSGDLFDSMQKPQTSEETKSRMRDAAASLAKSLNTPVKIVTSDEAPEEAKNAKGYYDTRTGEVVIVLDNNQSVLDIEKTVVHEIIGHHGLRGLLGSVRNYRRLMDVIYDSLSEKIKNEIKDKAMRNGYKFYEAMDEYFAEQAENMVWDSSSATMWDNIKHYITEAIRKLGFILRPNYRDVRYWLWLSKNNLQSDNPLSEIKRQAFLHKLSRLDAPKFDDYFNLTEGRIDYNDVDTAFRNGDVKSGTTGIILNIKKDDLYTRIKNSVKESYYDHANSLKEFQKDIEPYIQGGLMDNQNAYLGENQRTSNVADAQEMFQKKEITNLQNVLNVITPLFNGANAKDKLEDLQRYLMKKHGLERNRVLFFRDWFRDNLKKKIEKPEDLPTEAYELYEKKVISIETDFEDGRIDQAQRDKALQDAVQESWYEYLENVNNGFGKLHNRLADKVDNKTITLADMYRQLDEYINQYVEYNPSEYDYSGLTAFALEKGEELDDAKIIEEVMAIEDSINRNNNEILGKLQDAIHAITQKGLDEDLRSGIISKSAYDRASSMFRWYIPLRGFNKDVMEDFFKYDYTSDVAIGSVLKKAKGRLTLAFNPLATAINMTANSFSRGEKNLNKQRAYRAVTHYLKGHGTKGAIASVSDVWYKKNNTTGEYEIEVPPIDDKMSADDMRKTMDAWTESMKSLEREGVTKRKTMKGDFIAPFSNIKNKNANIVFLKINGQQKMIIFHGDPKPARVLNGEMAPEHWEYWDDMTRFMSSMATTYNPTFVGANLMRDVLFSNNNIWIKENSRYYRRFSRNQSKILGSMLSIKNIANLTPLEINVKPNSYVVMYDRYKKGIAPETQEEVYFKEFMENGGRTGITQQFDIDRIEKMIKLATTPKEKMKYLKMPLEKFGLFVEALNERVENANRFCAYMTSRQEGRSVMRSISDAKEITVNFNRKGASWKTAKYGNTKIEKFVGVTAAIFKHGFMFFNAGVQGFAILWNNLDKHTIKTISSMMLPPFLLGLLLPYLNEFLISVLGGDDDDYANLSPWKRRNNLCIYAGNHQFVTIPLPIEQRSFFGLGDIAYSTINNKYSTGQEPFGETMMQIADIFPVDYSKAFTSSESGLVDLMMPDLIKPIWQIHNNRDWTGSMLHKEEAFYNKYDPKYELAFDNENQIAVGIAKLLNKWTSDDKYGLTQGSIDMHPSTIRYLTEQYLGGAGKDALNTMNLAIGLAKLEMNFDCVPFVRGLLQVPNDKNKYTRIKLKYNNYRSESEEYEAKLKKFMKASKSGVKEQADYYKALAEEWKRTKDYRIMVEVNKFIKTKEKRFKKKMDNPALSDTDKKTLQEIFMADKKDLVERIEAIENQY